MRERPVVFGPDRGLVGVVTEPGGLGAASGVACIFLNAGLVHHVGPNRLYVRLSRLAASLGFVAMRLDVANRGDSDPRRDGLPFLDGCVADVRAAMDLLQQSLGVEKFVLMGICSGAINSIHAAMLEPRVVGAIAIDGPAHPTPGYYLRRYARRIVSVQSWAN